MTNHVGISLGWNCNSAMLGIRMGIRGEKSNGYKTCPFDACITNYDGMVLCIRENFKYFCDSQYLHIIEAHVDSGGIKKGEKIIYNSRYNFIFNHESPGHADLYIIENWATGMNHYVDNDFFFFKERYNRRIENYLHYTNYMNNHFVKFILTRINRDISSLYNTIREIYPCLGFEIIILVPTDSKELIRKHLEFAQLSSEMITYELTNK